MDQTSRNLRQRGAFRGSSRPKIEIYLGGSGRVQKDIRSQMKNNFMAGNMTLLAQLASIFEKCDWRPNVFWPVTDSTAIGKLLCPEGTKLLYGLKFKNLKKLSELCSN